MQIRGYVTKPRAITGYKIERYYCECGCKSGYWHYVKSEDKLKFKITQDLNK
jgi:hypothetical protein